jgi:hypothetical protein
MTQMQTVSKNNTTIWTSMHNGPVQQTCITLHSTTVVQFDHLHIKLNSGGWRTVTTKTRMNQASNQFGLGYRVYQKNYDWFVDYQGHQYPFFDGMTIDRTYDGPPWSD